MLLGFAADGRARPCASHREHRSANGGAARRDLAAPKRAKFFVYSDARVDELLAAALPVRPTDELRRWTWRCLFGLIVATGMHLSEAIGFEQDDVDQDNGFLAVRQTKCTAAGLAPTASSRWWPNICASPVRDVHRWRPSGCRLTC
jgi:hypothetical protein